jgi:hypothetical protein
MGEAADITAVVVAILNLAAALFGAWCWRRGEAPRAFWVSIRTGQLATTVMAGVAGIALVSGFSPQDGLFWLYLLLPIVVSIIAEQLRLFSAQAVLDARDLEDAQAVGALPEDEQRVIVRQIVMREIAVVSLAAAVIAFLALRVLPTT